jgi:hypothetical protein
MSEKSYLLKDNDITATQPLLCFLSTTYVLMFVSYYDLRYPVYRIDTNAGVIARNMDYREYYQNILHLKHIEAKPIQAPTAAPELNAAAEPESPSTAVAAPEVPAEVEEKLVSEPIKPTIAVVVDVPVAVTANPIIQPKPQELSLLFSKAAATTTSLVIDKPTSRVEEKLLADRISPSGDSLISRKRHEEDASDALAKHHKKNSFLKKALLMTDSSRSKELEQRFRQMHGIIIGIDEKMRYELKPLIDDDRSQVEAIKLFTLEILSSSAIVASKRSTAGAMSQELDHSTEKSRYELRTKIKQLRQELANLSSSSSDTAATVKIQSPATRATSSSPVKVYDHRTKSHPNQQEQRSFYKRWAQLAELSRFQSKLIPMSEAQSPQQLLSKKTNSNSKYISKSSLPLYATYSKDFQPFDSSIGLVASPSKSIPNATNTVVASSQAYSAILTNILTASSTTTKDANPIAAKLTTTMVSKAKPDQPPIARIAPSAAKPGGSDQPPITSFATSFTTEAIKIDQPPVPSFAPNAAQAASKAEGGSTNSNQPPIPSFAPKLTTAAIKSDQPPIASFALSSAKSDQPPIPSLAPKASATAVKADQPPVPSFAPSSVKLETGSSKSDQPPKASFLTSFSAAAVKSDQPPIPSLDPKSVATATKSDQPPIPSFAPSATKVEGKSDQPPIPSFAPSFAVKSDQPPVPSFAPNTAIAEGASSKSDRPPTFNFASSSAKPDQPPIASFAPKAPSTKSDEPPIPSFAPKSAAATTSDQPPIPSSAPSSSKSDQPHTASFAPKAPTTKSDQPPIPSFAPSTAETAVKSGQPPVPTFAPSGTKADQPPTASFAPSFTAAAVKSDQPPIPSFAPSTAKPDSASSKSDQPPIPSSAPSSSKSDQPPIASFAPKAPSTKSDQPPIPSLAPKSAAATTFDQPPIPSSAPSSSKSDQPPFASFAPKAPATKSDQPPIPSFAPKSIATAAKSDQPPVSLVAPSTVNSDQPPVPTFAPSFAASAIKSDQPPSFNFASSTTKPDSKSDQPPIPASAPKLSAATAEQPAVPSSAPSISTSFLKATEKASQSSIPSLGSLASTSLSSDALEALPTPSSSQPSTARSLIPRMKHQSSSTRSIASASTVSQYNSPIIASASPFGVSPTSFETGSLPPSASATPAATGASIWKVKKGASEPLPDDEPSASGGIDLEDLSSELTIPEVSFKPPSATASSATVPSFGLGSSASSTLFQTSKPLSFLSSPTATDGSAAAFGKAASPAASFTPVASGAMSLFKKSSPMGVATATSAPTAASIFTPVTSSIFTNPPASSATAATPMKPTATTTSASSSPFAVTSPKFGQASQFGTGGSSLFSGAGGGSSSAMGTGGGGFGGFGSTTSPITSTNLSSTTFGSGMTMNTPSMSTFGLSANTAAPTTEETPKKYSGSSFSSYRG